MTAGKYIAVVGPTASGKSSVGMALARALSGEIVSCDSVQIYKGFNIGSSKPSVSDRAAVSHHLIDQIDWKDDFDASMFRVKAMQAIRDINTRGKLAIVVGGTGLYLRSLWGYGFHELPTDPAIRQELELLSTADLMKELTRLDPERAQSLHPNDRVRLVRALECTMLLGSKVSDALAGELSESLNPPNLVLYLKPDRSLLRQAIVVRAQQMLADGLIEEVEALLAKGVSPTCKPMKSIGYRQVVAYLSDANPRGSEKMILSEKIEIATRQYAKKQETWFNRLPFSTIVKTPLEAEEKAYEALSKS